MLFYIHYIVEYSLQEKLITQLILTQIFGYLHTKKELVMISQMASEKGYVQMDDVIQDIHKKIVSRHTWVFGKDKAKTPEEALGMWRKNKEKEKLQK